MKAIIDVQYNNDIAYVALGCFEDWSSKSFSKLINIRVDNVAPYEPGNFYKRELPCILEALKYVTNIELIIIDGFVDLSIDKKGLGHHLYDALNKTIPIIGIAKTKFNGCEAISQEVKRGNSKSPLFITSIGISLNEAKDAIQRMHGEFRLPELVKLIDKSARDFCKKIIKPIKKDH